LQDSIDHGLADPELVRLRADLPRAADQEAAEQILAPALRRLDLRQKLALAVAEKLGGGRLDAGVGGVPLLGGDDAERLVGAPCPLGGIGHADALVGTGANLLAVDEHAVVHLAMQQLADPGHRPLATTRADDALAVQLARDADEPLALRGQVEDAANNCGLSFVDDERERCLRPGRALGLPVAVRATADDEPGREPLRGSVAHARDGLLAFALVAPAAEIRE